MQSFHDIPNLYSTFENGCDIKMYLFMHASISVATFLLVLVVFFHFRTAQKITHAKTCNGIKIPSLFFFFFFFVEKVGDGVELVQCPFRFKTMLWPLAPFWFKMLQSLNVQT